MLDHLTTLQARASAERLATWLGDPHMVAEAMLAALDHDDAATARWLQPRLEAACAARGLNSSHFVNPEALA